MNRPCPPEDCLTCNQGRECSISMQMHRLSNFHQQDGGMTVSGEDSIRLPAPSETDGEETFSRWMLIVLGAVAAICAALAVYEARPF